MISSNDTMKRIIVVCIFLFSIILGACNQPGPTQPTFSAKLSIAGYGETIDSSYYKVWSDSSWEKFYHDTTINGRTYTILLQSDSSEYLFDSSGNYSGFELPQTYGYNIIIFDSALVSLPDTLIGGTTYKLRTTFSFQGTQFVLIDDETLIDSGTVSTSFGTFTNSPVIQSNQAIAAGRNIIGGGVVVNWLAKGPSVVEQDFYNYFYGYFMYSITMAYGVVNGQSWGIGLSKEQLANISKSPDKAMARRNSVASSEKSLSDMRSIAPMILKGIRHRPGHRMF